MEVRRLANRREFLRLTVLGAAGTAILAACSPAASPAATTAPAPAATTAPAAAATTAPAAAATTAPAAAPTATVAVATKPATGAKTTIRYYFDETPGEEAMHKKIAPDYASLHPDVTLQPEPITSDWVEKTVAGLVSGTAPDLIMAYGQYMVQFATKGAFADITSDIKGWANFDVPDIYPASLGEYTLQGKTYVIPYCFDPVTIMFYQKAAFDDAKLSYPADTWTYDDFKADAIALTKKDASGKVTQWGFNGAETVSNWGWSRALPTIWAYGGDQYNADMTHCTLAEPEALQAFNLFYELKTKYNASPTPEQSGKLNYYQMFASGQCVMQTTGPWAIGTYAQMITDAKLAASWDLAGPPTGPKGRFVWASGNAWGLWANGKNKDKAQVVLQYLTDKDRSQMVGTIGRRVPARKSAGDSFVIKGTKPDNQAVFPASLAYARTQRAHPTHENEVEDIVAAAWETVVLTEKATPEQAMKDAVAKVDKLLAS